MIVFDLWEELRSHPGGTDLKILARGFKQRAHAEKAKATFEKRGKDCRIIERKLDPIWC